MPMYIIGIAGGTGSGKTTVARKIIESLPKGEVALIPQDSYYIDATDMTMEERRKINYDHPCAFDWKLLIRQVKELKAGRAIEQPTYSYLECNRLKETIHVEPRKVILIEGILALSNKELRDLMDIKIFVDADSDERLIRVIERDIIERGRTVQMVVDRYRAVLKPMHLEFIEPTKRYADLIIPQGGENEKAIEIMRTYILHHLNLHLEQTGARSMKVRISEFGWKAGFRLCRKRPDLWKIASKRGQSGSDLWKHDLRAFLLDRLCRQSRILRRKRGEKNIPFGYHGRRICGNSLRLRPDTGSRRTDSRHAVRSRHLL